MAQSEIIRIRLKPELKEKLLAIMKFAGFQTISGTVRQMIEVALNFYQERNERIDKIKKEISVFTIKPEELFPDIKIKRKYLGK